jgi:uncharacterized alkaline shock family protein YloU
MVAFGKRNLLSSTSSKMAENVRLTLDMLRQLNVTSIYVHVNRVEAKPQVIICLDKSIKPSFKQ